MLVELNVAEQRYRVVLEVLDDGLPVTEVACDMKSVPADGTHLAAAVPRVGDDGTGRSLPATAAECAPDLGGDGARGV